MQTLFPNQGLYNGFLVTGLVRARFAAPDNTVYGVAILPLGFVLIAATWGASSSGNKGVLFKQGLLAFSAAAAVITTQTYTSHSFLLSW